MKGEIARLARGSYLYFFGVFLFSCKVAQILLPLRPLKSRHREKCFDFGTNRHRESLWREPFRRSPSQHVQRVFLARVHLYNTLCLPILSVLSSSHFPPLLRAAPSPRRPFSAPTLLHADPSPRRPFSASPLAQPSLPLPRSPHSPHPFDSRSKENHPCSKEISERFVRKHPFKTVTCALQTAR